MLIVILLLAAFVLFILSAVGIGAPPDKTQSVGLACLAAALLVGHL